MVHFFKDVYMSKTSLKKRYLLYSLVKIELPKDKPHSLHFTIKDGYITPPIIQSDKLTEIELQKEMDVILIVMNSIFDEDNHTYYIGHQSEQDDNKTESITLHPHINTIANIINTRENQHITRPNRGSSFINKHTHNGTFTHVNKKKHTERRLHNVYKVKRGHTLKQKRKNNKNKA